MKNKLIFLGFFFLLPFFFSLIPAPAQEKEETYSISLVKTAGIEKNDIYRMGNKKVLTTSYDVLEGDWVWKILRERGLLKPDNLSEIVSILKKLNKSLRSIDLIHPGEKIIIPLKIVSLSGNSQVKSPSSEKNIPVAALTNIDFENYTVKSGDHLIKIIRDQYKISQNNLENEYLELVKKLNPSLKDLNHISPGQIVRLPVYSTEIVKGSAMSRVFPGPDYRNENDKGKTKKHPLAYDLEMIFLDMGEEWIRTGQHYIPLKSGGQIDLKAKSFPIINLKKGLRVIVDINNMLPEKMAGLIESSWEYYRVVHLVDNDLRSALDKIFPACDFPEVLKKGEPLELKPKGEIALKITGDWIIKQSEISATYRPTVFVINLTAANSPGTPQSIKDYLSGFGIKVINYPTPDNESYSRPAKTKILGGGDLSSLIGTLLKLTGLSFSRHAEIPLYKDQKADFKLTVTADFFLKVRGKNAIIDLTDLPPVMVSFLEEHNFLNLCLATEEGPLTKISRTLEFIGVKFDSGPHSFMATDSNDSKNITLTIPGIVFSGPGGRPILATPLNLPDEIVAFLADKGYKVLALTSK